MNTLLPRPLLFWLSLALLLGACNRQAPPATQATEYPVLSLEKLRSSRVFVGSAYQSFPGIALEDLGAIRHLEGDDPAYSSLTLNDSDWPVVATPAAIRYRCGTVHWFRVHYTIDPSLAGVPVHLHLFAPGAMEIYLNGRYLHHYGSIKPSEAGDVLVEHPPTTPRRMVRFAFPADGPSTGVLAFRYAVCPLVSTPVGVNSQADPAPVASILPLEQADRMRVHEDQTLLYFGLFVGCSFLIFLLTIILYSYARRERTWLFISLSALFTFIVAFTHLGHKGMLGVPYEALQVGAIVNTAAYPLSFLFLVLAMKVMFDKLTPRTWLPFVAIAAVSVFFRVGSFFMLPQVGLVDLALIALMFLEVARLTVGALRQRMYGRWILTTGAFFFFFGVFLDHYHMLIGTEMPWNLRTVMRFSYYLSMPTTITIFLAVKSAENGRLAARRRDELDAEIRRRTAELQREKEKSEQLLLNILPSQVADELKEKGMSEAREFDHATVLFADFIDFTQRAGQLPAKELLAELNDCFRAFDEIMARHHVEKIKTIGDAYMAAGGLDMPHTTSPADVVLAAIDMQSFIAMHRDERRALGLPYFEMRVGIHTGPVVAGIVGVKKFQYDIWGDTVNIASRMESNGTVGQVNISQATYDLIRTDPRFGFRARGLCGVKGKGEMMMYFVESVAVESRTVPTAD